MAPGGSSDANNILTAGDQIGHIYTSGNLTISGQKLLTVSDTVERLSMQLDTATVNAYSLGAWDLTGSWLVTNAPTYLSGGTATAWAGPATAGNLTGHDYIFAGGTLTLNQYGRTVVSSFGTPSYAAGQVFNLLDWATAFSIGSYQILNSYDGTGDAGKDLDLPTLSGGLLWQTDLFASHGVIYIIPEPSRVMLLFFGLFGLFFRRRRNGSV